MCGFVGVVRDPSAGPVGREELQRLLPDLRHRGPDGEGLVVGAGVGLAATRLAIQGDVRGDQPLLEAGGRLAVAFNGELFGRALRDLREWLAAQGLPVPAPEAGDTALLAAALAADTAREGGLGGRGTRAAHAALLASGMGALVAVELERGRAWLLRDRLGVKPLHLAHAAGGRETWFSSELTPLLRARGGGLQPSDEGLAHLWWRQTVAERTPFPGVSSLPGGRLTRLTAGCLSTIAGPEPRPASRADALAGAPRRDSPGRDALGRALQDAAAQAAGGAAPVTLFLSGGLDSSAVAWGAGRRDLLALTGRFAPAGGAFDESPGAAEVAGHLGLRHEVLDLTDGDLVDDLASVVRALELPVAGPGSLALWRLAVRARRSGRIVLTGTGGDELLGGYARLALALGREGPWTQGYEGLARRMAGLATPAARLSAALDRRADLAPLFAPGFRAGLERALPALAAAEPPASVGDLEPWASAWRLEVDTGTLPTLLHVEDRVLMAHGVEGRPVFCLGDVPAVALTLPPDELVGPDGEGKRALRALLAGRIPEAVRTDVRKRGFPTPFARAARGAGRERVEQLLADRRFRERGWWDPPACRALLDEERPGHDRALFALLCWETWARLFVDGDAWAAPPAPPPPAPPGASR